MTQTAVAEAVTLYRDDMMRYAKRLSRDTETAQDAVQDACLCALRTKWDTVTNPKGYLIHLVHNSLADIYRKAKAKRRTLISEGDVVKQVHQDRYQNDSESRDLLERCMTDLQPRQVDVLRGVLAGLSLDEIATSLGIAPVSARVTLIRARKRFTEAMQIHTQ